MAGMKLKWKIPLFLAGLVLIGLAGVYFYLLTYDFNRLGGGLERTRELIAASGLEAP